MAFFLIGKRGFSPGVLHAVASNLCDFQILSVECKPTQDSQRLAAQS